MIILSFVVFIAEQIEDLTQDLVFYLRTLSQREIELLAEKIFKS